MPTTKVDCAQQQTLTCVSWFDNALDCHILERARSILLHCARTLGHRLHNDATRSHARSCKAPCPGRGDHGKRLLALPVGRETVVAALSDCAASSPMK
jgi:hypothetical protein